MPSYYNKVKSLVIFVLWFILIVFLLPVKAQAYTSLADCKVNVQCDSSQCSTKNDRYCTGFFPDETACSYHESCNVSGNPSCDCSGQVGNFTYTRGACPSGSTCTGILGPNGSTTTCHYCQTPICTPGETDTLGCTAPTGCTATRTCTANYEWGACTNSCTTCTYPDASTIACGATYTPTNCSNPQTVTGTGLCPADKICSNKVCKDPCLAGQTIEGLIYSCQSTCPAYVSYTKACSNNQQCCYQGTAPVPVPAPPAPPPGCGSTSNPPLKYKCVSGSCVTDNCDGSGTTSDSTCGGSCPVTTTQTGTFRCDSIWAQQPQSCTSGNCNINLGANYSGTRTSPVQQCWSKDGTGWGCNTDSQATSNSFPCGQTSIVSMTARENFNASTGGAGASSTCPNASITPTCGGTPPPPPTGPLVCFRGDTNCATTGQGYWHSDSSGCACNCPAGTSANIFDQQRVGGVCYQEGSSPPPPPTPGSNGVVGSYWIKNADGSLSLTPRSYETDTLFPMFYWIYSPSGGYCGLRTTINGGAICYQGSYYRLPDLAYYSVADPYSIAGYRQKLQLFSWPDGYKPIGYYTYQSVQTAETKTDWTCGDTRCFGTETGYKCVDCGGQQCREADCSSDTYDTAWACKFLDGQGGYSRRSYGSLGPMIKGQINDVTQFCAGEPDTQDGAYARVDVVFEKDLSPQSCTVSLPTTSCNGTTPNLNLSWTASLNATSYDVYRSTDNGQTYSLLTNVTTNSYTNSAVSQNVTYYYKVTAKNTISTKDCTPPNVSAQVGVCDITPPSVGLSASFTSSGCYDNITWPTTDFRANAEVASPSTVSTVSFILTPTPPTTGTTQTYTVTSPTQGNRNTGIWKPTPPIPKPNPGTYTIKAQVTTQSGITAYSNEYNLNVQISCANPWLKTTGGDIHSNKEINLPQP